MAAAVGSATATPATSHLPLFRRPLPSSSAPCFCVPSYFSGSFSSLRCPPLGSKASTFVGNYRKDNCLRSGCGSSRRIYGTERLLGFASPTAKYIREDYLVRKVSAKEVGELVKGDRNVPLVVDFYATWCGPCIMMAQQLETLAVEYESNVLFVKVDTDDEHKFAQDMQVRGLPTLYFISTDPSKDAIRTEGLIPPEMIKNIIDNEM